MDNSHGKEIDLSRTTVKIPGVAFRQVGSRITSNGLLRSQLNDGGTGNYEILNNYILIKYFSLICWRNKMFFTCS